MLRRAQWLATGAIAFAAACSDATQPVSPLPANTAAAPSATRTHGVENYVAIGTSVSMGWASNGAYDGSQIFAFPALLRFGNGDAISLPLIQSPGCQSPLVAPLAANLRLSGEDFSGSVVCAPNDAGVQLPTQDVGLAGALALDVLFTTPETSPFPWFARVLPPHTTPLQAALAQQPTLVSIELGANEVLQTSSGLLVPGVTFLPAAIFNQAFDGVIGAVASSGAKGLIVEIARDATNFPVLRTGAEVWADRAEFAALHVDVSANCDGSPNYINVSVKSIIEVFTAAFTSTHGLPNPVFSCADVPGQQDLVLTPADIALVNGILGEMADHQEADAAATGFALTSLDELYARPGLKGRYSVISQMTSAQPYGPYISLDGLHPSPLGQSVLAAAAAKALNKAYPGIAAHSVTIPPAFGEQLVQPAAPIFDRAWATQVARHFQGKPTTSCQPFGGCALRVPPTRR